jgi:transposase
LFISFLTVLNILTMARAEKERWAVVAFWEHGYGPTAIVRMLHLYKLSLSFVEKTIRRYKETNSIEDRPREGRPKSARTPSNIRKIEKMITTKPNTPCSKLAVKVGISVSSATRILKEDLCLKPYKRRKAEALDAVHKQKRVKCCKALLKRFKDGAVDNVLFSDEKWFVLEEKSNRQNDLVWAPSFEAAAEAVGPVEYTQYPSKIMVWAGISVRGRTRLVFFEPKKTVNQQEYQKHVLEGELVRAGQEMFGDEDWTFMQDGCSIHTAKATQAWCATNLPNFLESSEWPPRSPDLNPCDFFLWGTLEAIVNTQPLNSFSQLKAKLRHAWKNLDQEAIARACRVSIDRMKLCIKHDGSRFE